MVREPLIIMACAPDAGAPGDVRQNTEAVLRRVAQAKARGAQLLVLPELCLSGSGLGSLYLHQTLAEACEKAALSVAAACGKMRCVFGLPLLDDGRAYSALALAEGGVITRFALKRGLKDDQKAVFSPGYQGTIGFDGRTLPCGTEGEMTIDAEGFDRVRAVFPDDLAEHLEKINGNGERTVYALPGLEPAIAGRMGLLAPALAALLPRGAVLAYANAGANESTTDLVYAGDAAIMQDGRLLSTAAPFTGEVAAAEIHSGQRQADNPPADSESLPMDRDSRQPFAPIAGPRREAWCRDALEIAARGLAARMQRIGAQAATLGVSGGLDSAMALLTTRRAFDILGLPRSGIHGYSLPGLGSSARTRGNALKLLEAMGLAPREIDLKASILRHFEDIGQDPMVHDAAFENAQARERTQVLMDLANRLGGLMVGSGDLSELALGFTTFGGDHMSMYGVNAGLYKSAIRLIVRQCAADAGAGSLRDTLLDILDTPISPELLPGQGGQIAQKTEDLLGPYELNDWMLHHFLADRASPRQMLEKAQAAFGNEYSRDEIISRMRALFKRFFASQFKRNCLPDGPMALGVSLSPRGGFSLASDASARAWLDAVDRLTQA